MPRRIVHRLVQYAALALIAAVPAGPGMPRSAWLALPQALAQGHEQGTTAVAKPAPQVDEDSGEVEPAGADSGAAAEGPAPSPDSLGGPGEEGALQRLRDDILQNPVPLDQAWLAGFCQYVPNADSLEQYLGRIAAAGAVFDSVHARVVSKDERDGRQPPRFFLEKSKTAILAKKVSIRRLRGRGRGYVALSLYRAYQRGHQDWGKVDPAFMKEFFKVNSLLHQVMYSATPDTSQEKESQRIEELRAREAALVDAYERLLGHRERLAQLGVDERAPAEGEEEKKPQEALDALIGRLDTQPWRTKWETPRGPGSRPTAYAEYLDKSIDDNLLALGRLYVESMAAETSSQERQEEFAGRAAKALSMVYLRSQSTEALHRLRQIERTEQDFMRQRARANWDSARRAAAQARDEAAGEYYFQATHDFLQCLARLQGQEKKAATEEFLQMREEIAAWKAGRPPPAAGGKN